MFDFSKYKFTEIYIAAPLHNFLHMLIMVIHNITDGFISEIRVNQRQFRRFLDLYFPHIFDRDSYGFCFQKWARRIASMEVSYQRRLSLTVNSMAVASEYRVKGVDNGMETLPKRPQFRHILIWLQAQILFTHLNTLWNFSTIIHICYKYLKPSLCSLFFPCSRIPFIFLSPLGNLCAYLHWKDNITKSWAQRVMQETERVHKLYRQSRSIRFAKLMILKNMFIYIYVIHFSIIQRLYF